MELDTGQLNSVLSRALRSSFGGTYPRDLIPHRLRPYEKAIVVNTDPHDKPGTHWVCMYVAPPIVEYFDSYGLKSFLPEIPPTSSIVTNLDPYGILSIINP